MNAHSPDTPVKSVFIIKPDLDTLAAALVAGVRWHTHRLVVLPGPAPAAVLANPVCLCLECGGSGQVAHNNFDHHNGLGLPPACVQAWQVFRPRSRAVQALVAYAAAIDSGTAPSQGLGECGSYTVSLGQVLGGMALLHPAPARSFWEGLRLLHEVVALGANPHNLAPHMHPASLWAQYAASQQQQRSALQGQAHKVQRYAFAHTTMLVLATHHAGVHGLLRGMGGQVRLALRPLPGGRVQVSLSCEQGWQGVVAHFLAAICQQEPGWGGPDHGTIVASPRGGSRLGAEVIVALARRACAAWQRKSQSQSARFCLPQGTALP